MNEEKGASEREKERMKKIKRLFAAFYIRQ